MRSVALALLMLVAACQTIAGSSTEVHVYEFGVDLESRTYKAGEVTLEVENEGEFGHTLVITAAGGHVVTAADLLGPGETAEMSVELAPGQYSFTCRIVAQDDEGNLIDHYEQGMRADVVVIAD